MGLPWRRRLAEFPTSPNLSAPGGGEGHSREGRNAMPITVNKSDAALGAEISVDRGAARSTRDFPRSRRRFTTISSCSFAARFSMNERHIAFSRRFGELEVHIVKKYLLPGYPEILLVSNVTNDAGEHIGLADAGFTWHSDCPTVRSPAAARCFTRRRCRFATGTPLGETVFANCVAAYEALPPRRCNAGSTG